MPCLALYLPENSTAVLCNLQFADVYSTHCIVGSDDVYM